MTNPLLWLLSPEDPLIDLGDGVAFGDLFFPLEAAPTGGVIGLVSSASGTSSITADLTVIQQLFGTIVGGSSVAGSIGDPAIAFEIPYLLGLGGIHAVELRGQAWGRPTVAGVLSKDLAPTSTTAGSSTVTGALFTNAGTGFLAGTIAGTSAVTGTLQVFDGTNIELSGTIAGTSTVSTPEIEDIARQQPRFLYLYLNVGVGYDDVDAYTGGGDIVSQSFPDGSNRDDFARYLYQYLNVGVGYNDVDVYSGTGDIVSQSFPDGDNRDDWARYLYLYLRVIRGRTQLGKLAVLPSGVGRDNFIPSPTPPSNSF